jgi:hypothetical protein
LQLARRPIEDRLTVIGVMVRRNSRAMEFEVDEREEPVMAWFLRVDQRFMRQDNRK